MITEWSRQEHQFQALTVQTQSYVTTFRWLWMSNLSAAIVGVAMRHYELTVVAAASSFIALIGVALARKGRKTVSEATKESHRIRHKLQMP